MLINANALAIPLANKSVHTIVTSPPYYGLRDYGTAKWQGGDVECDHKGKPMATHAGFNERYFGKPSIVDKQSEVLEFYKNVCGKCGAIRIDAQIGLEVTPDAYIANLVEVFRECKRILRDDGTLWVNIGDSYASVHTGGHKSDKSTVGANQPGIQEIKQSKGKPQSYGVKDKDLIGIPWMLAFALRADGWYLRQDIIWAKPNPMPESVKDRCTKSHEYIFLLSKSAKYYFDNESIKELATGYDGRKDTMFKGAVKSYDGVMPGGKPQSFAQNGHERWQYRSLETGRTGEVHSGYENPDGTLRVSFDDKGIPVRNKRDVWTITTKPYKGAHYATFNPDLIKPCILAGAPETCCAKCGAPYKRVVEREKTPAEVYTDKIRPDDVSGVLGGTAGMGQKLQDWYNEHPQTTTGYQPTCTCNAGTSSGIVFDPFVGSGTTVATAIQLNRKGIGIDLSFKYLQENAKVRVEAAELPLLNLIEQY